MNKRHKLRSGDIFQVPIDNQSYYFQFIMDDPNLFSSNIIRVFDFNHKVGEEVNLNEIIKKPTKFIAHTVIKGGIKLCAWKYIDNVAIEEGYASLAFRATDDVYSEVKKSNNWFVWKVGGDEVKVGKLTKELKNLPYGSVTHPIDIVEWIKTGNHGFMYPE